MCCPSGYLLEFITQNQQSTTNDIHIHIAYTEHYLMYREIRQKLFYIFASTLIKARGDITNYIRHLHAHIHR